MLNNLVADSKSSKFESNFLGNTNTKGTKMQKILFTRCKKIGIEEINKKNEKANNIKWYKKKSLFIITLLNF